MTDQLAGIADLMARWGYTRQGVHKLTKLPDFPAPIAVINQGRTKVWRLVDLEPFERDHPELHGEYWKRRKVYGYYAAKEKGE
mgnify:CR=1 FL=1|tara:strand:- start:83 stop:331 length:249 start_codon:yes stop_codon:yes gene_type:complete